MKTAISIPDSTFESAERLAKRMKLSRSELYTKAVSSYIQEHKSDNVTDILNEIYAQEQSTVDTVIQALQLSSLPKDQW
jgi:metal-responsive CopG/Arc/MetJ family transcriptional regulator